VVLALAGAEEQVADPRVELVGAERGDHEVVEGLLAKLQLAQLVVLHQQQDR
jgi:hypothetical protein